MQRMLVSEEKIGKDEDGLAIIKDGANAENIKDILSFLQFYLIIL